MQQFKNRLLLHHWLPRSLCTIMAVLCTFAETNAQPIEAERSDIEQAWSVRAIQGMGLETHMEFALLGAWSQHTTPDDGNLNLEDLIRDKCQRPDNDVFEFLVRTAMKQNGLTSQTDTLPSNTVVSLPFCLKMARNFDFTVRENTKLLSLLRQNTGFEGAETRRIVLEANNNGEYQSFQHYANSIKSGDTINFPLWAPEVIFIPQVYGTGRKPLSPIEIVREKDVGRTLALASAVFSSISYSKNARNSLLNYRNSPIRLVSALSLNDQQNQDLCARNPGNPGQVYQLHNGLKVRDAFMKAHSFQGKMTPSGIGIIDTGLFQYDSGTFDKRYFLLNPKEEKGQIDKDDDNEEDGNKFRLASRYVDDVAGMSIGGRNGRIEPSPFLSEPQHSHGTQMAYLALGGESVINNWLQTLPPDSDLPIKLRIVNFVVEDIHANSAAMASVSELSHAIKYLSETKSDIINMSLASTTNFPETQETIAQEEHILFVVASGNGIPASAGDIDGAAEGDLNGKSLNVVSIRPAIFGDMSNVMVVGGFGFNGKPAGFANYSEKFVSLLAPACGLISMDTSGGLGTIYGTSGATAIGSFAAGLLKSLGIGEGLAGPVRIRERLEISTDHDPDLEKYARTSGRLNIIKALSIGEDLVQLHNDTSPLIYGQIDVADRRAFLGFCESGDIVDAEPTIPSASILKIVPNIIYPDGITRAKFWIRVNGELVVEKCVQVDSQPRYKLEQFEVDGTKMDFPKLQDIYDIVFKTEFD